MHADEEHFLPDREHLPVSIGEVFEEVERRLTEGDDEFDVDAGWARIKHILGDHGQDREDDGSGAEVAEDTVNEITVADADIIAFPPRLEVAALRPRPTPVRAACAWLGCNRGIAITCTAALGTFGFIASRLLVGSGTAAVVPMVVGAVMMGSVAGLLGAVLDRRERHVEETFWPEGDAELDAKLFGPGHLHVMRETRATPCDQLARQRGLRFTRAHSIPGAACGVGR
ncbi:hypothetical protein ACWEQ0_23760 [Nocardia thailandica]